MLTLPIPLPDPYRNVAPAIAPPTVRQDCDQLQANDSRLPLRVIHDRVELTTGPAMSAMQRITPRGVRTPRNNLQIGIRQRPLQRLGLIPWRAHPHVHSARVVRISPGIAFGRIGRAPSAG